MPANYSGQNLRGRSFKGQDLEGVNFSGADIRGTNFTKANLKRANFSHTKAGLQWWWATLLIFVSCLMAGLSGLFFSFACLLMTVQGFLNYPEQIGYKSAGLAAIVIYFIFIFITTRKGIQTGLGAGGIIVVVVGAVAVGVALFFGSVGVLASTAAGGTAGVILGAFAVAFAVILIIAVAVAFAVAGASAVFTAVTVAFAVATFVAYVLTRARGLVDVVAYAGVVAGVVGEALAVTVILFSTYIGWRAMKGDEKHTLIRNIAVAFVTFGGTNFRNADLTDSNFTAATLKNTDFRNAILTRTCFYKTKKFDLVRPGTSYLQNYQLQQVLVSGQGQGKSFDRLDLRGVNLQGANLSDASFIAADLSDANFQDADLSRAKLVQAQFNSTDFTGATLTGAYIEDWNITSNTKFNGVQCQYIYMRLPTKENPDPHRKPDNREEVFSDGEFGDFIKPIIDTLDLYHSQGVDPRAIATAFKQLAKDNPNAELEIVAIERRGDDKILLRAKTATTANKSELSKEYFLNYNQLKALAEQDFKALIASQEYQISRLENMIKTALERPNFYAQTYNNQGDTTMSDNRFINTGGGNYNEQIKGSYIQGNYYATGQSQSLAQAAAEIQELLKQLEQTYPTTTTSQQMVVAAEAINRIESSPTMKQKVINAVKEGGLAAFEKAIDNPAGAFVVGAIKGWQEIEAEAKD